MLDKCMLLADDNVWALGANVTLSGMVIVFLGLILLVLVISLFSKLFGRNKAAQPVAPSQPAPAAKAIAPAAASQQSAVDDDALIAVIAAAVDAMYSGSGKKAVIRSVRPAAGSGRPIWAQAGILENTRAF